MFELADLVAETTVIAHLEADSADDVINALAATLVEAGAVAGTFAEAARERERVSPTGLDLGSDLNAAIPHAEREHVIQPGVAVATLARPVEFHRMDDPASSVSVRVVVMPAFSEPAGQVAALRSIAALLQDREMLTRMSHASTAGEVVAALTGNER